jgi:hypothetical protein
MCAVVFTRCLRLFRQITISILPPKSVKGIDVPLILLDVRTWV